MRVGIEATGHTHWFEALLAELGHELWMGDAAKIRAMVVRKQKTDARERRTCWICCGGACVAVFGVAHFLAVKETAGMVPKWIPPGQMFWARATGFST